MVCRPDVSPRVTWRAQVLTLYPEMFPGPLGLSLAGKALAAGTWALTAHDLRAHGLGRYRAVDDTPAGGGPGMVLRVDVLAAAIDAVRAEGAADLPAIALTPRGARFDQARARKLAAGPGVLLICGRFEGYDERIVPVRGVHELSIGDFVLSGGELGAMVALDACVRLLPGVMGAEASAAEESFDGGMLEYPHYTRPQTFEGLDIPPVLLEGNHARIAAWRAATAHADTLARRPDLIRPASAPPGDTHEHHPDA